MRLRPTAEEKVVDGKELLRMNTGVDSLIRRAGEIQDKCHDYLVKRTDGAPVFYKENQLCFQTEEGAFRLPMSRYSLSQLSSKIGVPANYIQKCIDSGRIDLAADNINSWLDYYNKDLFIREYDGHVRGVLSSKYSVCDTPDIFKVLQETVNLPQYDVKGSFLNEERLHLRMVSRELLPINGEDLFPGLFIDSSDVGRNVLTVNFGVWKQVCTNGLIVSKGSGTLFEQKHIGITAEEFYKGLSNSLKNVDFLCENAVKMVEYAKNTEMHLLTKEDFEHLTNSLRVNAKMSAEGAEKVIDLMQSKYDNTHWGFINSITEVAQDYTLERRLELERFAGGLLAA